MSFHWWPPFWAELMANSLCCEGTSQDNFRCKGSLGYPQLRFWFKNHKLHDVASKWFIDVKDEVVIDACAVNDRSWVAVALVDSWWLLLFAGCFVAGDSLCPQFADVKAAVAAAVAVAAVEAAATDTAVEEETIPMSGCVGVCPSTMILSRVEKCPFIFGAPQCVCVQPLETFHARRRQMFVCVSDVVVIVKCGNPIFLSVSKRFRVSLVRLCAQAVTVQVESVCVAAWRLWT